MLWLAVNAVFETTGEDFEKALDDWLEKREIRQQKRLPALSSTEPTSPPLIEENK